MLGYRVSRSTVYTGGCRGVFAVFGGCVPGVLGQNSVCIFYMFKRCRIVKDVLRLTTEDMSSVVMEVVCGLYFVSSG